MQFFRVRRLSAFLKNSGHGDCRPKLCRLTETPQIQHRNHRCSYSTSYSSANDRLTAGQQYYSAHMDHCSEDQENLSSKFLRRFSDLQEQRLPLVSLIGCVDLSREIRIEERILEVVPRRDKGKHNLASFEATRLCCGFNNGIKTRIEPRNRPKHRPLC